MREILLPAHRLLHHNKAFVSEPVVQPLTIPSTTYDTLRATLVQAELVLLRILGFDLRIPLPLEYLPRYLERAMEDVAGTNEDYDSMGKEEMEEFGVLQDFMETRIGRACKAQAISA